MLRNQVVSEAYSAEFERALSETSRGNPEARERQAQLQAIEIVFHKYYKENPDLAVQIWETLRETHLKRKANLDIDLSAEQIDAAISAHQSWIKSSGHAAELFWLENLTERFVGTEIQVFLQRDLSKLIRNKQVANGERDISKLKNYVSSSTFDLFVGKSKEMGTPNEVLIFGCLQSKTSIRERVALEREPSINAMRDFFWSAALVIDGSFLGLPKFQAMVNGSSADYPQNGWHALYALSTPTCQRRIHRLTPSMDPFVKHCLLAAAEFSRKRNRLGPDWEP